MASKIMEIAQYPLRFLGLAPQKDSQRDVREQALIEELEARLPQPAQAEAPNLLGRASNPDLSDEEIDLKLRTIAAYKESIGGSLFNPAKDQKGHIEIFRMIYELDHSKRFIKRIKYRR